MSQEAFVALLLLLFIINDNNMLKSNTVKLAAYLSYDKCHGTTKITRTKQHLI